MYCRCHGGLFKKSYKIKYNSWVPHQYILHGLCNTGAVLAVGIIIPAGINLFENSFDNLMQKFLALILVYLLVEQYSF